MFPAGSLPMVLALGMSVAGAYGASPVTLIETGAVWRYLDPGGAPGPDWNTVGFDDSGWKAGRAPLGYGRGGEATLLSYGSNPSNKPLTSYFRYALELPDPKALTRVTLRLIRDDGAVVYLNGNEIWRFNMPPNGPIDANTRASSHVFGADETRIFPVDAWPGYLRTNLNVLAVELHQYSAVDPDAWFDMPVVANLPYSLPEVEWVSPVAGAVLPEEPLVMNVVARDLDSSIWRVEFFLDGESFELDTSDPYTAIWHSPTQGRYRLQAEAIDNTGRRGSSPSIAIQIGEPLPDRVVRGPYLQSAAPDQLAVCWRTDWYTAGRVRFGTDPGALTNVVDSLEPELDHAVRLTGLAPATKYYYTVGTPEAILSYGPGHYFFTPPTDPQPTRIWVIGDSGTADENARDVYLAYLQFAQGRHTDVWLMLGDNAYELGTDEQYQRSVFEMYEQTLPNTVLWPTIGNHDAALPDASGGIPYLDIFTLPRFGEAGGVASGTERYYSFDHGQIHFICLDSSTSDRSPGGPMLAWLEEDLLATSKEWIIAFWHHPPYTFGTHRSDHERDLIEMRENVLPILEANGVDLVLSGHSHNYERSFLLRGHYGFSTNLVESMILDDASGNPAIDRSYRRPAGGSNRGQGTVYAVCGCSGEGGLSSVPLHPAMYTAFGGYGSMVLDIDGPRLEARMINNSGVLRDLFFIEKGDPDAARPALRLRPTAAGMELSWPASALEFQLERSAADSTPWGWDIVPDVPSVIGGRYVLLLEEDASQGFYRLRGGE